MSIFRDLAFPYLNPRATMAFGGGGGGETTSTSYTSSLPEYAEPYYKSLMERAEATTFEPYYIYDQPRISGFSPAQTEAMLGTEDLYYAGNPALAAAQGYAVGGAERAFDVATQGSDLASTYQGAQAYDPLSVQGGVFDASARDQYMSPYMDAVTERLKENAILDAQRQQKYRNAQAVQAGAFGGDRRFVTDYLADEGLLNRISDIDATQRQLAFENAQAQFERDRAARLEAAGMGEASRQYGTGLTEQGRQFGAGLEAQLGQFNKGFDLEAINALYGGADILGDLGMRAQGSELERIQALYDMGQIEKDQYQAALDQAYEDFINQRDYQRNQLTWLSGIMHGVPVSAQSDVVQYQKSDPLAGAIGSGIAGLGLYNSFTR